MLQEGDPGGSLPPSSLQPSKPQPSFLCYPYPANQWLQPHLSCPSTPRVLLQRHRMHRADSPGRKYLLCFRLSSHRLCTQTTAKAVKHGINITCTLGSPKSPSLPLLGPTEATQWSSSVTGTMPGAEQIRGCTKETSSIPAISPKPLRGTYPWTRQQGKMLRNNIPQLSREEFASDEMRWLQGHS